MKAKRKPLDVSAADSLGVDLTPRVQLVEVNEPEKRSGGIIVEDVATLVEKLKTEAKVI